MQIKKVVVITMGVLALALPAPASTASEFVVIVNSKNFSDQMDRQGVRDHFLMKQSHWKLGQEKVKPVDQSGEPEVRVAFLKNLLKMNNYGVKRHWVEVQYQQALRPAEIVLGDKAVIEYVASHVGGIGFIRSSSLGNNGRVKAVLEF